MNKSARKQMVLIAVTFILFLLLKEVAYAERGYKAIGGEYAVFLLPFVYRAFKQIVKDIRKAFKDYRDSDLEKEGANYE